MLTNCGIRAESFAGYIDEVTVVGGEPAAEDGVPQGAYVAVRGWLLSTEESQPQGVDIAIGGAVDDPVIAALLGIPRPDVAERAGSSVVGCGFYGVGAVTASCGSHPIRVSARFDNRVIALSCDGTVRVVPAADPLAQLQRREAPWRAEIDGFYCGDERLSGAMDETVLIPFDRATALRGWCADLALGTAPLAMVGRLGGTFVSVMQGLDRADVVQHLGLAEPAALGFLVPVVPPLAGAGLLELFAIFADGTYGMLPPVRFRAPEALPSAILPQNAQIRGVVDEVSVGGIAVGADGAITASRGQIVGLRGWAVDLAGPRLTAGVEAVIDDVVIAESRRGGPRWDVATEYKNSGVRDSEFLIEVHTASLDAGRHTLSLWGLSARADARAPFATRPLIVLQELAGPH